MMQCLGNKGNQTQSILKVFEVLLCWVAFLKAYWNQLRHAMLDGAYL